MGFFDRLKEIFSLIRQSNRLSKDIAEKEKKILELDESISNRQALIDKIVADATNEANIKNSNLFGLINRNQATIDMLQQRITELQQQQTKVTDELEKQTSRVHRVSNAYKSAANSIKIFDEWMPPSDFVYPEKFADIEELVPTVTLALHSDGLKDLKKQIRELNKSIDKTLEKYEKRYTTKANLAIYKLMVIALRAELQNILYSLKYGKIENATDNVKAVTGKYLSIASEGNQSIAGTMAKFIGEIEYLFIEVVKVEYEYYVRKERIKEEQKAIREQMRQEAEERKLLEQQQKQIEKEESKYKSEIEALAIQLETADESKKDKLEARMVELQVMLANVEEKKEEIINLKNGQAGYVYIISNIGSFGENVFKIGMTRRLEPMDRIKELGDASVPFPFDVHGMIFSDNAVSLENDLHKRFNSERVNKVNARKEYFRVNIDTLEQAVFEYDPAAEFTRTALAEQYRQTLSLEEAGITHIEYEDDEIVEEE